MKILRTRAGHKFIQCALGVEEDLAVFAELSVSERGISSTAMLSLLWQSKASR